MVASNVNVNGIVSVAIYNNTIYIAVPLHYETTTCFFNFARKL